MSEGDTPTSPTMALGSEKSSKGNEFVISDGQTETVVVYLDRAEVTRSFQAKVTKGENEIKMMELSECVDKDSIR
jgi:hypothetical protein